MAEDGLTAHRRLLEEARDAVRIHLSRPEERPSRAPATPRRPPSR